MTGLNASAVQARVEGGNWRERISSLTITGAMHIGVIGACDTGKTATALLLAGVQDGRARGEVKMDGVLVEAVSRRELARSIGFVSTDPSLLFSGLARTVKRELELSLQVVGRGSNSMELINKCASLLSLNNLMHRDPFSLSGGEQMRAALSMALVKSPRVLILDDIFGSLDRETKFTVRACLSELRKDISVVEFHSQCPPWVDELDRCIFFCGSDTIEGRYADVRREVTQRAPELLPPPSKVALKAERKVGVGLEAPPTTGEAPSLLPDSIRALGDIQTMRPASVSVEVRDWSFSFPNGGFQLGPISLNLFRGCATALIGPNGSGKTTLLRTLALLLEVRGGSLVVRNADGSPNLPPDRKRRDMWARKVMYAFQNPDDQIYLPTVRDELEETARLTMSGVMPDRAEHIASILQLGSCLDELPANLARPRRRLLTLASCFVAKPPLILLDEPTAGLDANQKQRLSQILEEYLDEGGTALIVSHDDQFIEANCREVICLRAGRINGLVDRQVAGTEGQI